LSILLSVRRRAGALIALGNAVGGSVRLRLVGARDSDALGGADNIAGRAGLDTLDHSSLLRVLGGIGGAGGSLGVREEGEAGSNEQSGETHFGGLLR